MESFDIRNFIQEFNKNCKMVIKKDFEKGEIICSYIAKRDLLCILVEGEAQLIRYDFNGNKNIVGSFLPNDVFGEIFYPVTTNNELFVIAKKNCTVLLMEYHHLQEKCTRNCRIHEIVVNHLSTLLREKIVQMSTRVEILTKRTIRDKLLTYFTILSQQTLHKSFKIPFSFTDLADYLSVDRSAMMREIKSLCNDGIIEKDNRKITLLLQ